MTTTEIIVEHEIIEEEEENNNDLSDIDSDSDNSFLGSELKAWIQQTHDVLNQKLPVTPAANGALDTTHITDDTSSVASSSVVSSEGGYCDPNLLLVQSPPTTTMEDEDDVEDAVSLAQSTQSLAQELGLILPSSNSVLSLASLDHQLSTPNHMVVLPPALLLHVDTGDTAPDDDDQYDDHHDLQNHQKGTSPVAMMIRSPKSTSPKNYSSFTFDIDHHDTKRWWYLPQPSSPQEPSSQHQVVYYRGGPVGCYSRSIQITKALPRPQRIQGVWQPLCLPYYEYSDGDSTTTTTTTTNEEQGAFSSNNTRTMRRGVWPNRRVAYYEVEILDEVDDATNTTQVPPLPPQGIQAQRRYWDKPCIAVGVVAASSSSASSNRKTDASSSQFLPGWTSNSFAYHSDDGSAWANRRRTAAPWGPLFGQPGDIIGCGMDYSRRTVFYTLNGTFVGHAASFDDNNDKDWIPTIGLDSPYGIACQFGLQRPFCFDLKGHFGASGDEETTMPPEFPTLQVLVYPPAVPNQKRARRRRRRRFGGGCFGKKAPPATRSSS